MNIRNVGFNSQTGECDRNNTPQQRVPGSVIRLKNRLFTFLFGRSRWFPGSNKPLPSKMRHEFFFAQNYFPHNVLSMILVRDVLPTLICGYVLICILSIWHWHFSDKCHNTRDYRLRHIFYLSIWFFLWSSINENSNHPIRRQHWRWSNFLNMKYTK